MSRVWIPVSVVWRGSVPEIEWCLTDGERFEAPFLKDDIAALLRRPFNRAFRRRTGPEALPDRPRQPDGLIFHMSRCGSTLVANMLRARGDCVVLPEPPALDAMLRPPVPVQAADHARWIAGLIAATAQPRHGERHAAVKLDSWHVLFLPILRVAFPDVPKIFLYREPREVIASHLRQRGLHTVPSLLDPGLFGIDRTEALAMPPAAYCARLIGRILDAAADAPDVLPIHYRDLPDATIERIAPAFGLCGREQEMSRAAGTYSKRPGVAFSPRMDAAPVSPDDPAEPHIVRCMDPAYRALLQRSV